MAAVLLRERASTGRTGSSGALPSARTSLLWTLLVIGTCSPERGAEVETDPFGGGAEARGELRRLELATGAKTLGYSGDRKKNLL